MDDFDLVVVGSKDCTFESVEVLIRYSLVIRENWQTFARALPLSDVKIEQQRVSILNNTITFADLIHSILVYWSEEKVDSATLGVLINAVRKCGANTVAELLRSQFSQVEMWSQKLSSLNWSCLREEYKLGIKGNLKLQFPDVDLDVEKLEGVILHSLMKGEQPRLFIKEVCPQPSNYIRRMLISRNVISANFWENILNERDNYYTGKEAFSDIFFFSGVDRYELSNIIQTESTGKSKDQTNKISTRFLALDQAEDFDIIWKMLQTRNKNTGEVLPSLHLLKKNIVNGNFDQRWVLIKSRGSMKTMQRFIEPPDFQTILDEEGQKAEILGKSGTENLPIIISDRSGMGKSFLLKDMWRKLAGLYPTRMITYTTIGIFLRKVTECKTSNEYLAIGKALEAVACQNELERAVLRFQIKSADAKVQMELLLDGFDDIISAEQRIAFKIIEIIRSSFGFVRLWLTSRPPLLTQLENHLGVLGYNIKAFDEENQLEFLTKYWCEDNILPNKSLRNFAIKCLKVLKSNLDSHDGNNFAGIPLQCRLIGEIYKKVAINHTGDKICKQMLKQSITNLYKKFIDETLNTYSRHHFGCLERLEMLKLHAQLSLELRFSTQAQQLKCCFENRHDDEVLKVGIIEIISSNFDHQLIHSTFADYFVAWFIKSALECDSENKGNVSNHVVDRNKRSTINNLLSLLLNEILKSREQKFKFEHYTICYFINSLLLELMNSTSLKLQNSVEYGELLKFPKITLKQIYFTCAHASFEKIVEYLDAINSDKVEAGKLIDQQLLCTALQLSSPDFVKFVVNRCDDCNNFKANVQIIALVEAAKRGNYDIMEFLLRDKKLQLILTENNNNDKIGRLLHYCVNQTAFTSGTEERLKVLEALMEANKSLINALGKDENSFLISHNVHYSLLKHLVKEGELALSKERSWLAQTCLHLWTRKAYLSVENYHSILELMQGSLVNFVKMKTRGGKTPLHAMISCVDPLLKTLEFFKDAKADFNCSDNKQKHILVSAIERGRTVKTIQTLIERGSNLNWTGIEGESLVHIAARSGHKEALKFLILAKRLSGIENPENYSDANGFTPADYLMLKAKRHEHTRETGLILYHMGGTFKVKDTVNGEWLRFASATGHFEFVKLLLLSYEPDVNATDGNGNTALHLLMSQAWSPAEKEDYIKTAELLIKHEANLYISNKLEDTPFHIGIRNPRLDWTTFSSLMSNAQLNWDHSKIAYALSFNTWTNDMLMSFFNDLKVLFDFKNIDEEGNSMLHHAAESNNTFQVKHLVEKVGIDVNLRNKRKQSPLHKAARFSNVDIIAYLIDQKADVSFKDDEGFSFLHYFLSSVTDAAKFQSLAELLVAKGCCGVFNVKNKNDDVPLHLMNYMLKLEDKTIRLLHSNRVDFNTVNRFGDSFLLHAVKNLPWSTKSISCLVSLGVELDILNGQKESLFHILARKGSVERLRFFLNFKGRDTLKLPDLHGKDEFGNTPLHQAILGEFACYFGLEIAAEFINNSYAPEELLKIKNNNFQTAYDIAIEKNFTKIATFLGSKIPSRKRKFESDEIY